MQLLWGIDNQQNSSHLSKSSVVRQVSGIYTVLGEVFLFSIAETRLSIWNSSRCVLSQIVGLYHLFKVWYYHLLLLVKVTEVHGIIAMSKVYSFKDQISKLLIIQVLISYSNFYSFYYSDA